MSYFRVHVAGPDVGEGIAKACRTESACIVSSEATLKEMTRLPYIENILEALSECDVVIADLTSPPDGDTGWQIGYACSAGKTVIALVGTPEVRMRRGKLSVNRKARKVGKLVTATLAAVGSLAEIKACLAVLKQSKARRDAL
jgi:nucleoside 2-deoxyribosyltransferase